jgi:hypothetical protein
LLYSRRVATRVLALEEAAERKAQYLHERGIPASATGRSRGAVEFVGVLLSLRPPRAISAERARELTAVFWTARGVRRVAVGAVWSRDWVRFAATLGNPGSASPDLILSRIRARLFGALRPQCSGIDASA